MATISVARTVGPARKAVLTGLMAYNTEKMGRQKYKRLAVTLKERGKVVGGIVGEVWSTMLFIQLFWMEQRFRNKGDGRKLIRSIEDEARKAGATHAYVDTMSFQAPGFYRSCGYQEFGSIAGYPAGITRHWFTRSL